jgi:hypothetical protein
MAISGDKGEKGICIREERKEEGISQRSNQQEFEACFPIDQARRLEGHLRLGEA